MDMASNSSFLISRFCIFINSNYSKIFVMTRSSNTLIFIVFGFSVITMSCMTSRQGIEGQVVLVSGNQMPSPDRPPGEPKGIKTTLYIYQLADLNHVNRVGQSAFYSN